MPIDEVKEGFIAPCERCGAPAHLVLGAPVPPCRYCGSASPLGPAAQQRLLHTNRLVSVAAMREHRRLLEARRGLNGAAKFIGIMFGITWAVVGGITLYICAEELGETRMYEALTQPEAARPVLAATYAIAALFGFFGLAASINTIAIARQRAAIRPPLALPPIEGGPLRCHLCGAGLHGEGAVRSCKSCGAKNLLGRAVLKQRDRSLSEQQERMQQLASAAVREAADVMMKATMGSSLAPIILVPLVAGAASLAAEAWNPALNYVWMGAFAPGLVAVAYLLLKAPLRVRALDEIGVGDEVRVNGLPYHLIGRMRFADSEEEEKHRHPPTPLHLLAQANSREPTFALFLEEHTNRRPVAFAMRPGGTPLTDPGRLAGASKATLQAPTPRQLAWIADGEKSARLFDVSAPLGAGPLWTLDHVGFKKDNAFVP